MPDVSVRDLHNAVAHSADPAVASARPVNTTGRELRTMVADVCRKLDPPATGTVLELGCGTGLFSLPLLRRARRYVGVDFAEDAVAALERRAAAACVADRVDLIVGDICDPTVAAKLPVAERVLVYATLHLLPAQEEAAAFVASAVRQTAPGGLLLLGNLPLEDLDADIAALDPGTGAGLVTRLRTARRWMLAPGPLGRTRRWRAAALAYGLAKRATARWRQEPRGETATLRSTTCVQMTRAAVESWVERAPGVASYEWSAPAVGSPMYMARADLLVRRDG